MMTRTLWIASLSALLLACPAEDPPLEVDSQAVCDCPAPTAATTTYDNTGSGLADDHVQGALDELAARPVPTPDVLGRIQVVEISETTTGSALAVAPRADCPEGGKTIGGSCDIEGDTGVEEFVLRKSARRNDGASWYCHWSKPSDVQGTFVTKAICLMPAE